KGLVRKTAAAITDRQILAMIRTPAKEAAFQLNCAAAASARRHPAAPTTSEICVRERANVRIVASRLPQRLDMAAEAARARAGCGLRNGRRRLHAPQDA